MVPLRMTVVFFLFLKRRREGYRLSAFFCDRKHAMTAKRSIHLLFLLAACAAMLSVTGGPAHASGADSAEVVSSSPSGMRIVYTPGQAEIDTVLAGDAVYEYFRFEGHTWSAAAGAPGIPEMSLYFACPAGSTPAVDISNVRTHERSGVALLPVPTFITGDDGIAVEAYVEDPALYALSGFRPETFAELGVSSDKGGLAVWELRLRPLAYDAHASRVRVLESCDITVTFGAGDGAGSSTPLPPYVVNRDVFAPPAAFKTASPAKNPFSTGDWFRVKITESGMYGVSGSELGKAGFPLELYGIDDIRMYYGGGWMIDETPHRLTTDSFREIAIRVVDRGKIGLFDASDTVVFYGESLSRFYIKSGKDRPRFQNHLYTGENVYWITASSEGEPKRIASAGGEPTADVAATTSYRFLKHLEEENHLELVKGGSQWYWDGIISQTKQYSFNAPGRIAGISTKLRIGFLNQIDKRSHIAYVYVNDEKATPHQFSNEIAFVDHEYTGELKTEGNIINIVRKWSPGEDDVAIHLDWIEIDYARKLEQAGEFFEFFWTGTGETVKFSVANITTAATEVFDATDPYDIREFDRAVFDGRSRTLTFQTTVAKGEVARFTLNNPGTLKKVIAIEKKSRSDLRNPENDENYIVVAHRLFMDAAEKLAAWRMRDSTVDPLITKAVDVQHIYDEFNWGVFDPVAIRDYFQYHWENSDTGKNYYSCFIGDTTYKYKNLTESQQGRNFVPTYTGYDQSWAITTDDFFSWFDNHKQAVFASGRLCVNDRETADALVDKIIDYEKNPEPGLWHNRLLLIADDDLRENGIGQETIHSDQIEELDTNGSIPHSLERTKLMMIEYPLKNFQKPEVTEAFFTAIQDGHVIINFIGHGNGDLLAHEHILVGSRDIERFNNGGKLPLFLIFSCSVGNFVQLDGVSLSEMLHNRKGGGVMGVISATVETYSVPNFVLNVAYYENLFDREKNPEHRIGHALLLAKHDIQKSNSNRYVLFGDPASRLMIPRYDVTVADVDSVNRLEKLELSGGIQYGGDPVAYGGTMYVRARGPRIHKVYHTVSNLRRIEYTQPGKIFFNGEQQIAGNGFKSAFVIPKDIPTRGSETSVHFFATGGEQEACGVLYDFAVGGLDREAPDDRSGPDIQIAFDNKNFDDGDYISRQPVLRATITDPSGINIFGNRGHNITLMLDNSEIIILTENFRSVGSYTTGVLDYTLPILTPGEHVLEFIAYDTYNNAAKKRVTANVIGSESGDVTIMNLLNYPNPMGPDGTTFTFSLTDDTRSAEIKVYSQSGRLVDARKIAAGYGFNTVYWKPPFTLANGVYFYKLTVRSVNGRTSSKIEKLVVMK